MTDSQIFEEAKQGNKDALGIIFDNFFDPIYFYIEKRVQNREDAEDITSVIWEKVYLSLSELKHSNSEYFKNWIYLIAKNTLRDFLRKNKIVCEKSSEYIDTIVSAEKNTPISILLEFEQTVMLEGCVNTLPEMQKRCVKMKYFDGFRNKEIAEILDLSQITVASNIKRGLEKLEKIIER